MRILMMADTPCDPDRGAAGTEFQTKLALERLGHEVDAIWADQLGRRIGHGNLHLLLELPRAYEREAVRALKRGAYDIVHVNQPHGFRAARTVHRLSPRTAFIHRSHGFEANVEATLAPWRAKYGSDERSVTRRALSSVLQPLLARHSVAITREADGHIVSSSDDAAFLAEQFGVDRARIAVIPQAAPDEYREVSAPPMTPERLRRVLYVGQFAFFKAPMITAGAINQLAEGRGDLEFTWICDRAHHADIRKLLDPKIAGRVELLHWMTQSELRHVYDRCGLFLFPSFYEGFGKAFLEAMSRGLCVVATDTGGMRDVIEHGVSGLLVPPGDTDAVATAARSILQDVDRAIAMSVAAAARSREYSWPRVARELAAFYQARLAARSM